MDVHTHTKLLAVPDPEVLRCIQGYIRRLRRVPLEPCACFPVECCRGAAAFARSCPIDLSISRFLGLIYAGKGFTLVFNTASIHCIRSVGFVGVCCRLS